MPQDFILVGRRYDDVVPTLKAACGAFVASSEYRLIDGSDDLPGVVLAAFARYLGRLLADGHEGDAMVGFQIVNALEARGDSAVSAAIRDEFLEGLRDHPEQVAASATLLTPTLADCLMGPLRA